MVETRAAHDLSAAALGGPLAIKDDHFVDAYGRVIALRGLNVSPLSKLPTEPNGLSHLTEGFYDHRTVTFAGRPFPLEEAPLHFRRLQAWGLPFIRLLVTWESLAHSGPNPSTDLDLEYIAYLKALVELMPTYGIKVFICGHQDVWSRYSGGSGAPGWTFEAAGLDIEAFTETGAAYIHGQEEWKKANGLINEREASGPFVWPSGYQKLAASTMATLFWAGDALAPNLKCQRAPIGGGKGALETVSVQSYLQDAFIEAFGKLADTLGPLEAFLGFEAMNEPHRGLISLHDFHGWNYDTDLHIGHYPSLAQALALGSGYAQNINFYVKSWPWPTRVSHSSCVDPKGKSAWLTTSPNVDVDLQHGMGQCVWRAHGVWEWDEKKKVAVVLDKDYFDVDHRPGRDRKPIEWYSDFYAPFIKKFSERVTRNAPHRMTLLAPIPNEFIPPWPAQQPPSEKDQNQTYTVKTVIDTQRPANFVYAPHFYDLNVLFGKHHAFMHVNVQGLSRGMFILNALYFGAKSLRKNYRKQLGNIVRYGQTSLGPVPTIIGEIGIPFDINGRAAFLTGWYDKQRDLMNGLIAAMEDNMVGFTLWNYNPHNKTEYGDGWNKEDFSIINGDDEADSSPARPDYRNKAHEDDELYRGGRALDVIIRPYAVKIAGKPVRSDWNYKTLKYEFEWVSEGGSEKTTDKSCLTEVYIPSYHYAKHDLLINVSDGDWSFDQTQQTLLVRHRPSNTKAHHRLVVEITKLQKHLLERVATRRQAGPPDRFIDLLPAEFEAWLEEKNFGAEVWFICLAVVMAILAAVVQLFLG